MTSASSDPKSECDIGPKPPEPLLIVARKAGLVREKTRTESVVARRMRVERAAGVEPLGVVKSEGLKSEEGGDQRRQMNLDRRVGRSMEWTRSRLLVLRMERCVGWRVAMCRPSGEGMEGWVEEMSVEVSMSGWVVTLKAFLKVLLSCKQRKYRGVTSLRSLMQNHNREHAKERETEWYI
jgi:hypothetical protein